MVNTSSALIIAVAALGTASVLATPINAAGDARDLSGVGKIKARAIIPPLVAEGVFSRASEETRDLEGSVVERSEIEGILSRAFENELEARQMAKVVEEAVDVAKKVAPVATQAADKLVHVFMKSQKVLPVASKAVNIFMKSQRVTPVAGKSRRDLEGSISERSEIEDIFSRAFEELEARQVPNVATLGRRSEIEDLLVRAVEEELDARQMAKIIEEAELRKRLYLR